MDAGVLEVVHIFRQSEVLLLLLSLPKINLSCSCQLTRPCVLYGHIAALPALHVCCRAVSCLHWMCRMLMGSQLAAARQVSPQESHAVDGLLPEVS